MRVSTLIRRLQKLEEKYGSGTKVVVTKNCYTLVKSAISCMIWDKDKPVKGIFIKSHVED